jgi:hypothetical protein
LGRAWIAFCFLFTSLVLCAHPSGLPGNPEYPDKPAGLKKLVQDLLKAEKDGDQQRLKEYWEELKIPNSDQWISRVFGDRFGPTIAKTYTAQLQINSKALDRILANALRDKMTQIDVLRFDKPCDSGAGDGVYPLLAARQQPQPIYIVKLANGTYWTELFAFAYIEGGFRYLPQPRIPQLSTRVQTTRKEPSGGDEGSGNGDPDFTPPAVTHQVPPIFPEGSGQSLTDSVKMNVLIGTDGSIKEMYPISGRCAFVEAFQRSVKKWTFSPAKLDGTAYESWYLLSEDFTRTSN